MSTDRYYGTATRLADGRVLVTGGLNGVAPVLAAAELYDPATGTFAPTGSMTTPRYFHRATLLADGRVLITGGQSFLPTFQIHSSAEIYDPVTGTFTAIGNMTTPRVLHTATRLADGKVLIAGGGGSSGAHRDAELYDPATNSFGPTGSMVSGRATHTATLLHDGKVLVAGGGLASAELYDPATGAFAVTGSMARPREEHTATLIADGRVLVAGGFGDDGSTELYDPASGLFAPAGSMSVARFTHAAAALPGGGVLISGGAVPPPPGTDSTPLASAEVFDPATGNFSTVDDMNVPRQYHTATRLADGRVLIAGGDGVGTAELYAAAAASLPIEVVKAEVKLGNAERADGEVGLKARFTYPGVPDGVIKVVFDGITLIEVPFASFEREHRNHYEYRGRNVRAKIDLERGTVDLSRHRMLLSGIDNSNGIDVVISFGASVGTDHFVMREHGHHGKRTLSYGTKTHGHDHDGARRHK